MMTLRGVTMTDGPIDTDYFYKHNKHYHMAKKKRTDDIPLGNFNEMWAGSESNTVPSASDENNLMPYSGKAIQKFIKHYLEDHENNKLGYIPPMTKDTDGFYHIRAFASKQTYADWVANPSDNADLKLLDVTIPISDESGAMSVVELSTATSQTNYVSVDGKVTLKLRFTSQTYNPVTQKYTDTYEDGMLTIQRRANASESWRNLGTLPIKSVEAEGDEWVEVDISNMLNSGTCQVRVIVTGDQSQATTPYVVFQSVTKTELKLTFRNEWQQPITGSVIPLLYTYTGAVAKTLNLTVTGEGGTRSFKFSLGKTEYVETPNQFDLNDSDTDTVKLMTHGVHTVEAWLAVDGTDIVSETLVSQVMVVTDSSNTTPYILLNNINRQLVNWTSAQFFEWAVYAPNRETIPVTFKMTNIENTETYMAYTEAQAKPETVYAFSNTVEVDSKETGFSVYMWMSSHDVLLRDYVSFSVDNSQNFAPTDGADLIINPKMRSNTEETPGTIINAVDGGAVPATFEGFGFVSDGWVADNNGIKCLRVPSGRSVTIDYETFSDFIATRKTGSLTFEIDFATSAVTDMEAPILKMCSYTADGNPLGWEMRATEACFMTQGKVTRKNQDVGYQEGERTKIAVNLLYNLSNSGQNYCRIFVNGNINREFNYATDDVFVQYVDGVQTSQGIRIGAEGADIDIYSLKVYKKALSSTEVMQDYKASLDSGEEKKAFHDANDIMSGNAISYDLAYSKYNTLLWKGRYATYGNTKQDKFKGDLVIHIPGDPGHSGTLYDMNEKGQGTSSMLYYWWNGQWGFNDGGHWVDENGVDHGKGYQLEDGLPMATKLVGKVNFASSMQSHKPGSTALYNDLWKEVCGGNSITKTEGFENTRSAVIEKPFLLFVQEDETKDPEFKSFSTFGPGKGDKPTFGYDKTVFPDYVCIEGADNDRELVMGRVPWIDEDVVLDDEDWKYNGQKQWSLVFGSTGKIAPFKNAMNFVFTLYDNIDYYVGTIEDLNADKEADIAKHYWLTKAGTNNAQYDLYRYDALTSTWVGAGTEKLGEGQYSTVNINTQCGGTASGTDWAATNATFKAVRTAKFRDGIGKYFNITELQFTMNFCKLIAASDNRGKNIYCYVDPVTHLIGWHQDDLDTIFDINNVGQKEKPYHVEEHDLNETGGCYWNSEGNSLFNQMENAFPTELRLNMRAILQAMSKLSPDGTLMGCMEKYYFSVQKYYPAVAYNEVARIVYERARTAYVSTDENTKYTNGTDPITQSLGDKLQAEMQWVKLRLAYISSYAGYGEFGRRDGEGAAGSLNFRSIVKTDGSRPSFAFSIVPHIWMYPSFAIGSTLMYGVGNTVAPRVKAGEQYDVTVGTSDGNTNIFLNGIDYMRTIGDFTDKSLGETFNLSGARLTKFIVDGTGERQFRPTGMTVTATLLQELVLKDVATLVGGLDLSRQTKLRRLVLTGTSFNTVTFPATEYLEEAALPATLTALSLDQQPNLKTVTLEGALRMQSLSLGAGLQDARAIFNLCFTSNAPLSFLKMSKIDWDGVSLYMANYMASITDVDITGKLALTNNSANRPTFQNKVEWLDRWGHVDDASNPLYITYYQTQTASISIKGEQFMYTTGEHKFYCLPNSVNANDVTDIRWELGTNIYASITGARKDYCVVTVNQLGDEDTIAPTVTLKCYLTKTNGTVLEAEWQIGMYPRRAHLGDYVFYDGTYGPTLSGKTVVGICFYINPQDPSDRRMVALQNMSGNPWGLYPNANDGVYPITLQDNENYSVYDIAAIPNIGGTGLAATGSVNHSSNYIEAENYLDEETADGFVSLKSTVACGHGVAGVDNTGKDTLSADLAILSGGYKEGDQVPAGLADTLKIIRHRNIILEDSGVQLPIPEARDGKSELAILNELITQVIADNEGLSKYRQFYYPAASQCYAYQPAVKEGEELIDKFKLHNWYLPSAGELARIYWHSRKGGAYENDNKIGNIFQTAIGSGTMTAMSSSSWYWSSSEGSSNHAWYVYFGSGDIGNNSKCNGLTVRSVAAF